MKKIILGFCLIFLPITIFAWENNNAFGTISGKVLDSKTEKPLENAIVAILSLEIADTTDSSGTFSFTDIIPGRYDFEVELSGYITCYKPSMQIKTGVNNNILFALQKEKLQDLERIIVSSGKIDFKRPEQTTSVIKLTRDEIKNSPGAFEDVNEVIKILPAAIGTGNDWDNSLLVRGGSDNENIYLIDGMEVNTISHWGSNRGTGGAICSFHPDFIEQVDFYAGGFPASTPPRLSSVSVLKLREGSYTDYRFQTDMNMAGIGMFIEGPLITNRISFMINGRVSFLDLVRKLINTSGLPKYQNGQLKVCYQINKENKLYTNILGMHDDMGDTINDKDDPYSYHEENQRMIGGLGWDYISDKFKNNLTFSGMYAKGNDHSYAGVEQIRTYNLRDIRKKFQLRNNCSIYLRENDVFSFGIDAVYKKLNEFNSYEGHFSYIDTGNVYRMTRIFPNLETVSINENTLKYNLDTTNAYYEDTTLIGIRGGAHCEYSFNVNSFKLNAGFRSDYYSILNEYGISPRLSATLDINSVGAFSVSSGLYYQFPTYLRLLFMKSYLDKIKLQRNWQVAFGYETLIKRVIMLGTEVYFKYYDREPLYNIHNQRRIIDTAFATYGKKQTYGIELYVKKKKRDKFYYSVSYTLFNSKLQYKNKKWYNADYNLRNYVTIVIGSQFHRFHAVSLRCDLSEGYPYTPIDIEASGINTLYNLTNGWNSKRYQFRAKIGLRYDLSWYLPKANITLYCEIKNLLNQRDVLEQIFNPTKREIYKYEGMGILPIGGLTVDF